MWVWLSRALAAFYFGESQGDQDAGSTAARGVQGPYKASTRPQQTRSPNTTGPPWLFRDPGMARSQRVEHRGPRWKAPARTAIASGAPSLPTHVGDAMSHAAAMPHQRRSIPISIPILQLGHTTSRRLTQSCVTMPCCVLASCSFLQPAPADQHSITSCSYYWPVAQRQTAHTQ